MVELTQSNGRKLAVNPAQVVSIEDNGTSTLVLLVTRNEVRVTEPYAQVLEALSPSPLAPLVIEGVNDVVSAEASAPAQNPRKRETK
jgi:hypothetical protein